MLTIDGAMREGGGQVLRSALTLSVCLSEPFRIINIRARRARPGLRPQHLAAVQAAAEISGAEVIGAELGGLELSFFPGHVRPGEYRFSIGTAGSTTLLLQTVLPALLTANGPSALYLEGGTHNPRAPTFDFVARAYLPLIERMGPKIEIELEQTGFYPRGGGRLRLRVDPVSRLSPWQIETRGALKGLTAEILLSKLPRHIADREIAVLSEGLDIAADAVALRTIGDSLSPGNVVTVISNAKQITEVFAACGRRGVRAERVASEVVHATTRYLEADIPVGEYLADQLLLPLALAGAGCFVTLPPSRHTVTNVEVIERFLDLDIACTPIGTTEKWRIAIS